MNSLLLLALSPNLNEGLEVIAAVSIASCLFCPLFCWILTHPNAFARFGRAQAQVSLQKLDPMLRPSCNNTTNEPNAA
jgi:hypothetical protein